MQTDSEAIENTIKAGKILSEVREESRKWVKPGIKLEDLADKIEEAIRKCGAECAFPANLGLNDIAAHYTPPLGDETIITEKDLIKIDMGCHIDGYVADTAYTISFADGNDDLLNASENALEAALKICKPGVLISDISAIVEKEIKKLGMMPIENLTGHGLSRFVVHDEPSIPNVSFKSDRRLEENEIIALEPFATNGKGRVKDTEQHFIFRIDEEKSVRNPVARKIAGYAMKFNGLPFAERWAQKASGANNFSFRMAMKELIDAGVIVSYPVLREVAGGLVAQFEHTVIVAEEPVVVTR